MLAEEKIQAVFGHWVNKVGLNSGAIKKKNLGKSRANTKLE
jgi:hypothetical protein